jgi:putative transposase
MGQDYVQINTLSNRAENSHRPTRSRERQMRGFRDASRTQAFLSGFGPIRQYFVLQRHQMQARKHRAALAHRLAAWQQWPTELVGVFAS